MSTKYLQLPSEEQREDARKGVNSTADSVKRDVQALIEWIDKQPHLPKFKDEDVLAYVLLSCKNSLEKTKHRLEMYSNIKAKIPEVYGNLNPFCEEILYQKNLTMYVPLRKLTPDGYRAVMFYISSDIKTQSSLPSGNNFFRLNQMTIELLGKLDYAKGVIVFHDAANITASLVTVFLADLAKFIFLIKKALPIRYKKIYFCNMSQASEILLTVGKSMVKKGLANRVEILKNPSDICKALPREIVPREYGGDELPLQELKELWFEEIQHHHEYLRSTEKYFTDESKVPKYSAPTEFSGMVGSFRQISID